MEFLNKLSEKQFRRLLSKMHFNLTDLDNENNELIIDNFKDYLTVRVKELPQREQTIYLKFDDFGVYDKREVEEAYICENVTDEEGNTSSKQTRVFHDLIVPVNEYDLSDFYHFMISVFGAEYAEKLAEHLKEQTSKELAKKLEMVEDYKKSWEKKNQDKVSQTEVKELVD